MKRTKFSCLEMKRRGAELIEKKIENMTREQEYKFWKEQTQSLKNFQDLKQKQTEKVPATS